MLPAVLPISKYVWLLLYSFLKRLSRRLYLDFYYSWYTADHEAMW